MDEKIVAVLNEMSEYLSISQMKKLQEVILKTFSENEVKKTDHSNLEYLQLFIEAKRIEGCSERTIQYYKSTAEDLLSKIEISVRKISTEEIRNIKKKVNVRTLQLIIFVEIYPASFPGWRKKIIF